MKIELKSVKTSNTLEQQYSKVLEEKKEFLDAVIFGDKDKIAEEACDYLQALKTYSDMRIINPKYRFDKVSIEFDITNSKYLSIFMIMNNESGLGIFCKYLFNFINNLGINPEEAWANHLKKMESRGWAERTKFEV